MTNGKIRGMKRYSAGILTAAALLVTAVPVYAETARPEKGINKANQIETLVENGTISQSTYESIQSYWTANQPEERTGFLSEAVTDGIIDQETADKLQEYMQNKSAAREEAGDDTASAGKGRHENMWSTMLSEGIITQDEYDAIIASVPQRAAKTQAGTE